MSFTSDTIFGGARPCLTNGLLSLRTNTSERWPRSQRTFCLTFRVVKVTGLPTRRLMASAGTRCHNAFTINASSNLHRSITTRLVRVKRDTFQAKRRSSVHFRRLIHVINMRRICAQVTLRSVRINRVTWVAGRRSDRVRFTLSNASVLNLGRRQIFFLGVSVFVMKRRPGRQGAAGVFRRLCPQLRGTSVSARFVGRCPLSVLPLFQPGRRRQAMGANGRSSAICVHRRGRVYSNVRDRERIRRVAIAGVSLKSAPHSLRRCQVVSNDRAIRYNVGLFSRFLPPFATRVFMDVPVTSKASIRRRL